MINLRKLLGNFLEICMLIEVRLFSRDLEGTGTHCRFYGKASCTSLTEESQIKAQISNF